MTITQRIASAIVLTALATPATAQGPGTAAGVERLERLTEQANRQVEARLQAQEQAFEAARRRREEAERQRQDRSRQRIDAARQRRDAVRRGPELTDSLMRTIRLGRDGALDLTNMSGDVVVTGGGGEDVRIEAVKRVWGLNDADARALLQRLEVQITERAGEVEVRTVFPGPRGRNAIAIDYTIRVPREAAVTIRNLSGDVRIANVNGELRAETVSGNIATTSVGRLRAVKTVSGDVQIDEAEGVDFTGSTVSGAMTARNVKSRAIEVTSVTGDIRFTGVESDRVSLRALNGDIDFGGRLARGGRYELRSHSGDLRVTPANANGFDVEAGTFSGDVRSDFALTLGGSRGAQSGRVIRGSYGDKGASLVLRSFSGNIDIVTR